MHRPKPTMVDESAIRDTVSAIREDVAANAAAVRRVGHDIIEAQREAVRAKAAP